MIAPFTTKATFLSSDLVPGPGPQGSLVRRIALRIGDRDLIVTEDDFYGLDPAHPRPGDPFTIELDGWWARANGLRK